MIEHSPEAWDHIQFKGAVVKVSNVDIYYRAVTFYFNEQPSLINDVLKVMSARIDHTRVVQMARRVGHLPLIKPYLISVQPTNTTAVNEALNELLVEEEDFDALRSSVDNFDNFDFYGLAQKLEAHELLEFRRIAAYLYKKHKKYSQSVALSKKDKLYKDAIETAAFSGDKSISEDLLKYFVEKGNKEGFTATLFTCYDLIGADVALEQAWKANMIENAFPYFIQVVKEYTGKVDAIVKEREKEKDAKEKEAKRAQEELAAMDSTSMYMNAPLAIEYNPAGGVNQSFMPGMQQNAGFNMGGYDANQSNFGGYNQSFQGGFLPGGY